MDNLILMDAFNRKDEASDNKTLVVIGDTWFFLVEGAAIADMISEISSSQVVHG